MNTQRLPPVRTILTALLGLVWAVTVGALRDFVWADLRAGMIHLGGLPRGTRLLLGLGFALLLAMVAALIFNDVWRSQFDLISMPGLLNMGGRGRLLPVALVPATFLLLTVAWTFALTGALHSHPAIRLGALALYLLTGVQKIAALIPQVQLGVTAPLELALRVAVLLAVPALFALRWRKPARPVAEFLALLVPVAAALVIAQWIGLNDWRVNGVPLVFSDLESDLLSFQLLVAPLLLLIGIDVANFARRAAGWVTAIISDRLPQWAAIALLLIVLAWRIAVVFGEAVARIASTSLRQEAVAYSGALGELLAIGLVAWVVIRRSATAQTGREAPGSEESPAVACAKAVSQIALPLVIIFLAMQLGSFVVLVIANVFPLTGLPGALLAISDALNNQLTAPWHIVLFCLAIAAAVWLAGVRDPAPSNQSERNGTTPPEGEAITRVTWPGSRLFRWIEPRYYPGIALYLGMVGSLALWSQATSPNAILSFLYWRGPEPTSFWLTAVLAIAGIAWLAQRQLTPSRALQLLFLLLITILLRQTDFIESPFSPFLGFAGISFMAFGIVWGVLTGGSWANVESAAAPRVSRIFLYVGYVLLTATVINWALAGHDLASLSTLTGGAADAGFGNFGIPLLYAIFAATLVSAGRAE